MVFFAKIYAVDNKKLIYNMEMHNMRRNLVVSLPALSVVEGSKTSVILFLLLVVFLSTLGCQSPEQKLKAALEAQLTPILTFDKVVHDFGEIGPEQKKTVEFQFTNSGNGTLIIKEVKACCGVTASKLRKKKYAPGKGGTLKFEYTSAKYLGSELKRLHILSNDKYNPNIALTLKSKIVTKVDWEPKSFKLILEGENTTCPKITINSLDEQPFSITSFKSSLDSITFDIDPSVKATQFVLEPKVHVEKIQENMRGFIQIRLNHPEWKAITIAFHVPSMFTITPPQMIIFEAEPNKPIQRSVKIVSNFDKDFEIEGVSSKNNLIKLINQNKGEHQYQLELEITPPNIKNNAISSAAEGQGQTFEETIFIKIKDCPTMEIPCNGFYLIKD
jgi:hypothetical protein